MSTAKKSNSYRLRMLTTTAMLGAMAGLLMLIEFPLGFTRSICQRYPS